jgi:hypothetical protein
MSDSFRLFFPLFAAAALSASAQEAQRPQMTARELFYNAGSEDGRKVSKKAALGLKYTILKLSGDTLTKVPPSSVFHAGDKIQFSIETNGHGYLYIVSQGSSGTWKPMFPSPEIEGGNNSVEGSRPYTFPSGYGFVFDRQAGDEKLFIVFSRDPKPNFGQLRASIGDSTVERLRKMYSRDLIIERLGDDARPPADNATQEKAVYVVNASGNADSALVADLHLVHQ